MTEQIGSLPDPDAIRLLQIEFDDFVHATERCDQLVQQVQAAFKSWGGLAQKLREVMIHTQEKAGEAALDQPHHVDEVVGQILDSCAESLAELSDEIAKLTRFFGAISCLAQHAVHSHVRSFTDAVTAVLKYEGSGMSTKKKQVCSPLSSIVAY